MKWLSLILLFLFVSVNAQDEEEWRVIPSVTQWLEEINNWPEEEYRQEYLNIHIDLEKDKHLFTYDREERDSPPDTTVLRVSIEKLVEVRHLVFSVELDNEYDYYTGLNFKNLHFKKDFRIYNNKNGRIGFINCVFDDLVQIRRTETYWWFDFSYCHFKGFVNLNNAYANTPFRFRSCVFEGNLFLNSETTSPSILVRDSHFKKSLMLTGTSATALSHVKVYDSKFQNGISVEDSRIGNSFELVDNDLQYLDITSSDLPMHNTFIPFDNISGKIVLDLDKYERIFSSFGATAKPAPLKNFTVADSLTQLEYQRVIASYSKLLTIYQNRGDYDSYNQCYVEMKNLVTDRLRTKYDQTPSFASFFDYQINIFLKVFSDYGTRPAKAIEFSLYVILIFAAVYLFFPNHWDSHGKTRIMDRYRFFLKYLNRDEGASEVYEEEKQKELLPLHEFREYLEQHGKTAPKFFYTTAVPLYKWSVSGSKLSGWILSKIDVLNGKWSETPEKGRLLKSTLVIGAFIIALIYDILIKVLNAVMLSINTFTTLGFGEIPIKGLPRYLAIIQGFIGWFMLTIFSVSLISQLLN